MIPTLKTGCLAYIDSIACGLVPCKVKQVSGQHGVEVLVTATRGGYLRGRYEAFNSRMIVPRDAVRKFRSSPFPKILPYSTIYDDMPEQVD